MNIKNYLVLKTKVYGKYKIETLKSIWSDEIICLISRAYSFKYKDDSETKNKLKGISNSQTKHIRFEEYKNCLFGEDYERECDKYNFWSIIHEKFLQKVYESTLSIFDDKRCYRKETESTCWR